MSIYLVVLCGATFLAAVILLVIVLSTRARRGNVQDIPDVFR